MRYADIKYNDIADGNNVCVSFWTQGCPHRCAGCHNPETWSFDGGYEDTVENLIDKIIKGISANGIQRNFSVLGGEPLCPENAENVKTIVKAVRQAYPTITIYLWTGYYKENIPDPSILDYIDILIDGPYDASQRDITLPLRGSRNQRVWNLTK